ncbi:MAG TPA: FG-GAP repeat protein [Anaerolineae bacterium]|nr:FG-GAP repeat protein [Anaerolineae bacterium]
MNRQHVVIGFLIVALTLAIVPHPLPAQAATPARPAADFDGDKYDDLVIGVPYEAIGSAANAGAVHALYGAAGTGLGATGSQLWYQDVDGVLETSEAGDEFGFALAVGDFDGDSFLDLAVGVHGEAVGFIPTAGAVHVFYGTAAGLAAGGNELWHQDAPGIADDPEADDRFGWALTARDFDGDGYDDLAVGVPWEDVGDPDQPGTIVANAGAVHVIYGSVGGLTADDSEVWYEGQDGIKGGLEPDSSFGHTLGAGDFNADGRDDLVVGKPWSDIGGFTDCGLVHVIPGGPFGLSSYSDRIWYQSDESLGGGHDPGDNFGHAVATGDSNGDGYDDLAVGVPYEDIGSPAVENAGAVHIVLGSATGLTTTDNWLLHQDLYGVADKAEPHDNFGLSLASGDFDGNGFSDLAIGVPGEESDLTKSNAGAVHIVYSQTFGENELWDQDDLMIQNDAAEAGDGFGHSLAAGNFDGDGYADLAVGVPWEDLRDPVVENAGAVDVMYGSAGGLSEVNNKFWHQASTGIGGSPEVGDLFGFSLAAIPTVRHRIYLPVVHRGS